MKEEAKKLPPKIYSGELAASTPTKVHHDEILSTLLRINNFDSISSIKDESLDIDLSACVTISPVAGLINGNSFSSTDFWRVMDESAQNAELNLSDGKEEIIASTGQTTNNSTIISSDSQSTGFSVTFLRPDPPNAFTNSPLKKTSATGKSQPIDRSKIKHPTVSVVGQLNVFKEEPLEEQQSNDFQPHFIAKVEPATDEPISTHQAFGMFTTPKLVPADNPLESNQSVTKSPTTKSTNQVVGTTAAIVGTVQRVFKCLDCNGLELIGQQEFIKHELSSHRIRLFYKCNECEREFEQEAGLKKHLKSHRPVEGRKDTWKKCPDCGKCLKLGSMWMHRKIHSDNKKYGCDICGQKFVQKINLTHHARIHSSEKPYECPECQKRFQERSHLQRHQKYHAQTRSYRCEKCGKMYKTERCLKVHNLVHLEQRPFACNVCDKSFISNSKLKQHSNIHTGMRPFKCNYCPRDFTNFPNWLKHTRRRHKVDHKTGEHLENIPSYCSKKSTSAKSQKAAEAKDVKAAAAANEVNTSNDKKVVAPSATPVKPSRKKKQPTPTVLQPQAATVTDSVAVMQNEQQKPQNGQVQHYVPNNDAVNSILPPKQPKVKRERKQLTPKQLQKVPVPAQIKKEILSTDRKTPSTFLDMHCLSITSAEELIMEQALEMEECGLYDAPPTDVGNDNAISSEAAAALHFQIKHELTDDVYKEDEFVSLSLKKTDTNRLACPSLESSPFSSPASIELATSSSGAVNTPKVNTTYYMPSFSLSAQSAIISNATHAAITNSQNSKNKTQRPPPLSALTKSATTNAVTTLSKSARNSSTKPTEASHQTQLSPTVNHIYLPVGVGVPLLVQQNQVLPSVDTLLFSAHAGSRFYHGKAAAQQNLS